MDPIKVPPYNRWWRFFDWLLKPVMYMFAGTVWEQPQETHRWNNLHLLHDNVSYLNRKHMVHRGGVCTARRRRWGLPIFHLQIVGGWRDYVVVAPATPTREWFVGWIADDAVGVSVIPLSGPVRVLRGDKSASWFGIDREGNQVMLKSIGKGRVGGGGRFAHIHLR